MSSTPNRAAHRVDPVVERDRVGQGAARRGLGEQCAQGVLLAVGPVEVTVGKPIPLLYVGERLRPIEMVDTLAEVDALVAGRRGDRHVDAAYGVDHRLETGEVDHSEVVDAQRGEVLDGLNEQAGPAE
ncbi:MAG: hypothetical protein M3R63_04300 [Actinomycetota bacterium]|nr:hypothetical protein [Actinomycetota bacterium]